VIPEQFLKRDPHKLHVVDLFGYIDEQLRTKLLSFNARKVKRLGGRIDYDIDGKLVGNRYREPATTSDFSTSARLYPIASWVALCKLQRFVRSPKGIHILTKSVIEPHQIAGSQ
jgi:hypothetical protein